MFELFRSGIFDRWLRKLRDRKAKARIIARLDRLANGHLGDVKSVGDGISELRIDHGPGYRVYFTRRGTTIILLLCAGDKSTQVRDIEKAKTLAREWNE